MERCKEFFRNISKTGWIVISLVIVVILLVIIGIVASKKGADLWPFNNSGTEQHETVVSDDTDNTQLLAQVDRALQSTEDSVFSVEDVLNGKYDNSVEAATLYVQNTTEVKVAVVIDDTKHEPKSLEENKCGAFAFVVTRVPDEPGIINETLKAIFADKVITDFEPGNIVPKYNPGLVFDSAVLENGVAKIYLRGEFGDVGGTGCATSLTLTEIEDTVRQFDSVKEVEIYQNLQKVN